MAIDTVAKRCSAINYGLPFRGPGVVPDVTFPKGERQAADHLYSGIAAGSPVAPGDVLNRGSMLSAQHVRRTIHRGR